MKLRDCPPGYHPITCPRCSQQSFIATVPAHFLPIPWTCSQCYAELVLGRNLELRFPARPEPPARFKRAFYRRHARYRSYPGSRMH